MKPTIVVDFGKDSQNARRYKQDNPGRTLRELLRTYPARFPDGVAPKESDLDLPLSAVRLQLEHLPDAPAPAPGGGVRSELDGLWGEEQAGTRVDPDRTFPERITDGEAVQIAYRTEMEAIADYLRHGLSVLVVCDKILTEHIYRTVCARAGKEAVLDTAPDEKQKTGLGGGLDRALDGGPANPVAHLPVLIHNLKPREVLVLRSLELLDTPPMIELLYQHSSEGEKPQLLAFLDPSLEVRKVLTNRFAVHVGIMGLARYVEPGGGQEGHTVSHLLTRDERARFRRYDPEGLYKNVAGLNAVQFRNAMQYVGAIVAPNTESQRIYRLIREFKTSSSEEIGIPDTTFDDIGGYEHVKQQLQRIVALVAGPMKGMSEKQRGELIPRGFIFHGPPGTGKTLFAKAIANEMNATIQMISGPEIMDKYVGQSENNLRRIFATARRNAPAVVFFDEFDSIASQRSTYSDGGARANNAVVAQFLTELDGFHQEQAVLVIGTTNRIDIIDEALLRPSRLRPIEIQLPDFPARRKVADIHARSFGVDVLLKDLCRLALEHAGAWEARGRTEVPDAFLESLFGAHPPYQTRFQAEEKRAGFLREIQHVLTFVQSCRQNGPGDAPSPALAQVAARLVEVGKQFGMDLEAGAAAAAGAAGAADVETWLLPMRTAIRDMFALLQHERQGTSELTPDTFFDSVIDLVADYSDQFNNDEIRAIFQEASLEHHMEGQLVSPRYLGQKIGLIRKRRDEREATHLSTDRGRR